MWNKETLTAVFIKTKEAKRNVRNALLAFTVSFLIMVREKLVSSCPLCVLPDFTALQRLVISLKRCVSQEHITVSWELQTPMSAQLAGADSTVPRKDTSLAMVELMVLTIQSYVPLATIVLLDQ